MICKKTDQQVSNSRSSTFCSAREVTDASIEPSDEDQWYLYTSRVLTLFNSEIILSGTESISFSWMLLNEPRALHELRHLRT